MVLNFFQLRNYTDYTFQLINSENNSDNYTVGPHVTTARHDMWLAQGDGAKGVTVNVYGDGSPIRNLLYMWDHDWGLRHRLGNDSKDRTISVNGNKDFSIDVTDTTLTFICYNGSFNSSQSKVAIDDWKQYISGGA